MQLFFRETLRFWWVLTTVDPHQIVLLGTWFSSAPTIRFPSHMPLHPWRMPLHPRRAWCRELLPRGSGMGSVAETPRWRLNTSIKFGFLNFGNISIKIGWREYEPNMQIYWMDPCMWFYIFTLIWIWKYPEWTSQKRGKGGKHRFDRLSQIRSSIQVFNTNKVVGELFKYT